MPYLETRFIFDSDLVSRLIGWQTDSLWCHTEGLSRDGKSWVGAHAGSGVQARPLDYCKPLRERRYRVPVTEEQYERAMKFQESKIGTPYNLIDIIGLALHKRIGASEHEMICSAFEIERYMYAGIYPLNCLEGFAYLVTPETLHLSPIFIGHRVQDTPAQSA
jgi:hypothetical protein